MDLLDCRWDVGHRDHQLNGSLAKQHYVSWTFDMSLFHSSLLSFRAGPVRIQ